MFYFLLKIMVCILVVFCIHTIWQNIQEQFARPRIKNTNAEIEKYKSLVESISQQNISRQNISRQNKSREGEGEGEGEGNGNGGEENRCKLPKQEEQMNTDIESDLNSFLDSILIENHIEIMPVVM
jgi:hypothetical protein